MARKPIAGEVLTGVLLRSRRRCALCYGLNRELTLKPGQIAHLDRDAGNAAEDNLVFLCLEHHDAYDSRTSQSKGLTAGELRAFRAELHAAVSAAFALPATAPLAGHWIKVDEGSGEGSADLRLTPMPLSVNSFLVSGASAWAETPAHRTATGEIDFVAKLDQGALSFTRPAGAGGHYGLNLQWDGDRLVVTEQNPAEGMKFQGVYKKAP
jgi:hypothetical protein